MCAPCWSRSNTRHPHSNHKSRLAASCNLVLQSHRPHLGRLSRTISLLWILHHLQACIPALLSYSIFHLRSIVHLRSTGHLHSTARLHSNGHPHSTARLHSTAHLHRILCMRPYKSSTIPGTKFLPPNACRLQNHLSIRWRSPLSERFLTLVRSEPEVLLF